MAVHSPPTWEIDGIVLNAATDTDGQRDYDGIQWILTPDSDVLGSAELTTAYADKYQRIGSNRIPGEQKKNGGTLVVRGYARHGEWAALERARRRARALCSDSKLLYPLVFNSEAGPLVQGITRDGPILTKHIDSQDPAFEISMQFAAPDPRYYDLTVQQQTTGVPQNSTTGLDFTGNGGGGVDFTGGGLGGTDFGPAGAVGKILLDNTAGTAPSPVIMRLDGRLDTPVISVADGSIKYNDVLAVGDFIDINPEDPSFLLNGTTARNWQASPAQWNSFIVPPGSTLEIGLSHSGPSTDLGSLTAFFRAAYW